MNWQETDKSFQEYLKQNNYSIASQRLYNETLRPFKLFLETIGVTDVRRVTEHELQKYRGVVIKKNLSIHTRNIHVRAVKLLYKHLTSQNHILINPCEDIKNICIAQKRSKIYLSPTEIEKIMSQPDTGTPHGIRDRALLELIHSTGIRTGECVRLAIYDIDTKEGLVRIKQGMTGGERVIPMNTEAVKWVKDYQQLVRPRLNKRKPHIRSLFLSLPGNSLTRSKVMERINTYVRKANLTKNGITCQTFRNTFVVEQIKKGTDIVTIQKLMGHRDISNTMNYARLVKKD